jgi:hypothetical protein
MRLSTVLSSLFLSLTSLSSVVAQNATSFGPLGTSPTQRHELNQTQALQILSAAAAKAASLGLEFSSWMETYKSHANPLGMTVLEKTLLL